MLRHALVLALSAFATVGHAQECGALVAPAIADAGLPGQVPVAAELDAPRPALGAPSGVLAQAYDASFSIDHVLFRLRVEQCGTLASITPARAPVQPVDAPPAGNVPAPVATAPPAVPAVDGAIATPGTATPADPAAYVPRTAYDNAPWRFNMHQDGKRMTADAFAEWMEAKGVRVATGRPAGTAAAPPVATDAGTGTTAEPPAAPARDDSE